MSAFLDSLSGAGYDGSDDGGIGDVGGSGTILGIGGGSSGGYFSGALQSLTALGTGYLSRRLDIDLYGRAVQAQQPQPQLGTTQNQVLVGAGARGQPTMLNLNALLPFLLVGAVVFFVAKKAS
ncbi:hypothetical protein CDN99_25575 [Roseateles aquatilis]|uniref:Uncharacterized protein n=1 Tax=Roseateles aquatilis TaxID=431061 RepID=A0A246IVQ1_9BURK|nr:hypothetical protein [Roseateles aquatilis]OWQ83839.1 hypothetical protein CDN99_25575 [Roseateles aquatilis]